MTTRERPVVTPPATVVDLAWLRRDLDQFRLDLAADIVTWERRGLMREASHAREVYDRVASLLVRLDGR